MPKRSKGPKRFYNCARCRSLIPHGYKSCGTCGYAPTAADALFVKALAMFPGSREVK